MISPAVNYHSFSNTNNLPFIHLYVESMDRGEEIGTDDDDGLTYWLSEFEVWATQAQKSCTIRGGTLAEIFDKHKQEAIVNMFDIWDVDHEGRYCIAGNFVTAVDFPKSGYYWLESSKDTGIELDKKCLNCLV